MEKLLRKLKILLVAISLLSWVMISTAPANAGPKPPKPPKPPHSVAEPATLALLGVGLVSVSLYALKKRNKR